jgi:hypothetical protein
MQALIQPTIGLTSCTNRSNPNGDNYSNNNHRRFRKLHFSCGAECDIGGNTVTVTLAGLTSSTWLLVSFVRDSAGHLSKRLVLAGCTSLP